MTRLFVAVNLSDELVAAAARLERPRSRSVAWVSPANLHVTLKFLGETDDAKILPIADALAPLSSHLPFEIAVRGVGAFLDARRPRVLWAGVVSEGGRLEALARAVDEALAPLGFEVDRRGFHPHLTLARVKGKSPEAAAFLEQHASVELGACTVTQLVLYESKTLPSGPRYRAVQMISKRVP